MCDISGLFLKKGSVIATDKLRFMDWVYKSKVANPLTFERILILQNENSASSSENMITALKDNLNNVTLIGKTTFGKGIGQYTLPLKRGYAVKATILKWYTAKGENIQHTGIVPNINYNGTDAINFALECIKQRRKE